MITKTRVLIASAVTIAAFLFGYLTVFSPTTTSASVIDPLELKDTPTSAPAEPEGPAPEAVPLPPADQVVVPPPTIAAQSSPPAKAPAKAKQRDDDDDDDDRDDDDDLDDDDDDD